MAKKNLNNGFGEELVANSVSDLVFALDAKGNILFYNQLAQKFFDIENDGALGRSFSEFLNIPDTEQTKALNQLLKSAIKNKKPLALKTPLIIDHTNEKKQLIGNITPISAEDGGQVVIVTLHDITEKKRLERELEKREKQLFSLINNLPGAIYQAFSDRPLQFNFLSDSIKTYLGYSAEELIKNNSRLFNRLILPKDRELRKKAITDALKSKNIFRVTYRIKDKKGKLHWFWEQGRLNTYGKHQFIEGFISDISEKLRAQLHIEHLNHILMTIRNINQLIVREKNEEQLLKKCCKWLVKSGNYRFACLIRLDDDLQVEKIYTAGLRKKLDAAAVETKLPRWLSHNAIQIIRNEEDKNRADYEEFTPPFIVTKLVHDNKTLGLFAIGIDDVEDLTVDAIELLSELANDIAYAIHSHTVEEQKRLIEEMITLVHQEITGSSAQEVLRSLCEKLARALKIDLVFISERKPDDPTKMQTIAVYRDNHFEENFEYELEGTPSARIIEKGSCIIPQRVVELFPQDQVLKKFEIEGYLGAALVSPEGQVLGVLAALSRSKLRNIPQIKNILQFFSHRAVSELRRLELEKQLKASEERYRMIFENSPFGIYQSTIDGRVLMANPALIKMLGYDSFEDLAQRNIEQEGYYYVGARKKFIEKVLKADDFVVHQDVWVKKDGSPLPVREKARAVWDDDGNFLYFEGTVEDITEQKEKEEQILYQNQLLSAVNEAILATDLNYRITYWNKSAEKLYGWKSEEVIGKKIDEIIRMEIEHQARLQIRKLVLEKGFWQGELIHFDRNGRKLYIDMSISLMYDAQGRPVAMVGINRDISDKIKYEEALRESEASYRGLFNSVQEAIYVQAKDGRFLDVNRGAEKMYGFPREYLIGKYPADLAAPGKNDMEMVKSCFIKALNGEPQQFEFWGVRANGEHFPKIVRLYKGHYFGEDVVIALAMDITEQKKVEDRLRQLTNAIEQSPVSVIITDTEGNIEYVNRKFTQVSGYSADEVMGQNPRLLKSGKMPQEVYEDLWRTIKAGKVWHGELLNKRKDGTLFWEDVTISPLLDEKGEIKRFLALKEDITQRKKLEEEKERLERQLHQNQRLETIGTLAGGIAHDFNNILTPILGYAEMLKLMLPHQPDLQNKAEQIIKASLRARDLIQQILTFSRQIDHQPKPVFLQNIVNEAYHFLRASIPSTITVVKKIDKNCPPVMADPAQLHQVLMNLCTNAYHAMEKTGGQLSIELRKVEVDEVTAQHHPGLKKQSYVRLSVADTGVGMEPQVLERIFEPFFTTKGVGKGTGLGLSVVHGIVKNSGGEIIVYSEKGKGTIFHVYLPAADVEEIEDSEEVVEIRKGNEAILLVDDEPAVLEMEKQMLEYFGYQVTAIADSTRALEHLRQNKNRYKLLITDLTMPKMTGVQLAKMVKKEFPDLPVILITGYSEQLTRDMENKYGIKTILMKPIVAAELAQVVRQVLDEK